MRPGEVPKREITADRLEHDTVQVGTRKVANGRAAQNIVSCGLQQGTVLNIVERWAEWAHVSEVKLLYILQDQPALSSHSQHSFDEQKRLEHPRLSVPSQGNSRIGIGVETRSALQQPLFVIAISKKDRRVRIHVQGRYKVEDPSRNRRDRCIHHAVVERKTRVPNDTGSSSEQHASNLGAVAAEVGVCGVSTSAEHEQSVPEVVQNSTIEDAHTRSNSKTGDRYSPSASPDFQVFDPDGLGSCPIHNDSETGSLEVC